MSVCPRKFDKILKWPRLSSYSTPPQLSANCILWASASASASGTASASSPPSLRHFTVEENLNCIEGRAETSSCSSYFPLLPLLPLFLQLLWSHPVQTPCQLCLQLGFATDLIRWKFHKIVEISATFSNCSTCIFWGNCQGGWRREGEGERQEEIKLNLWLAFCDWRVCNLLTSSSITHNKRRRDTNTRKRKHKSGGRGREGEREREREGAIGRAASATWPKNGKLPFNAALAPLRQCTAKPLCVCVCECVTCACICSTYVCLLPYSLSLSLSSPSLSLW